MNSARNICVFVVGTLLAIVAGDAPYAPAVPQHVYGPPLAPYAPAIPAPVYGAPKIELPPPQIITSYDYKLITPPKPVEVYGVPAPYPAPRPVQTGPYPAPHPVQTGPYPAPIAPALVYGAPKFEIIKPVTSSYTYDVPKYIPKVLEPYPAPAPVYGVPKLDIPILPAPVYGVPKFEIPAPAPVYGIPRLEIPAPAPVYGVPKFEIPVPAPVYGIPKFEIPAKPVLTSYDYQLPAQPIRPLEVYGAPKFTPYPAPAPIVQHTEYGVPHF